MGERNGPLEILDGFGPRSLEQGRLGPASTEISLGAGCGVMEVNVPAEQDQVQGGMILDHIQDGFEPEGGVLLVLHVGVAQVQDHLDPFAVDEVEKGLEIGEFRRGRLGELRPQVGIDCAIGRTEISWPGVSG